MMIPTGQQSSGVTLMDLNVYCQLKIFSYLSLTDAAKVSEVCRVFQDLAVEVAKKECKTKTVRLNNNSRNSKLESTAILRNFGSLLQKVHIVFDKHGNDTFLDMIIEKCSSQLTHVLFSSTCFNVQLENTLSKESIGRFNAKFGNLKTLRFGKNTDDITDRECIEQHFPALEELSLFGYPFLSRNVEQFVKLNPQMKRLSSYQRIEVQSARNLLEIIDQQIPQLEQLGLWIHGYANETQYQPRFLKNLQRLNVRNYGNSNNLQHLSISNESVTEMECELGSYDETFIDFVCQYKELKKLAIRTYINSSFDSKFLQKLKKHLPKLVEIEICGFWKNLNHMDVVHFVHGTKQLVKFTMREALRKEILIDVNQIQKNLDSAQWTVVYHSSSRQLNFSRV